MNKRLRRYKALHDDEGCEAEDTQNQHDNDMSSSPLVGGGCGDGERDEEEDHSSRDEKDT